MAHKRKTKPVPVQVIPPFRPTNALFQGRLIDFDTGSAALEEQHMDFIIRSMARARLNSAFHVRIFGFASRIGDAQFNMDLSRRRMNEVYQFMRMQDGRVLNSIDMFEAFGESQSGGGERDDAPEWRAVEVHIFIGEKPPIDPPDRKKIPPPPKPPLPGGPRFGDWEVATPGGATFTAGPSLGPLTAGAVFGINVFAVRHIGTQQMRQYIQIVPFGLGASLGIPVPLKSLMNLIQTFVTGINWAGQSFTRVFPPHPVTFAEIGSCLVTVSTANAGIIVSASIAVIDFDCPGVAQYGQSGLPISLAERIWSFNSSGRNWQLGAGVQAFTGPLVDIT